MSIGFTTSSIHARGRRSALALLAILAPLAACGGDPAAIDETVGSTFTSFEDFESQVYVEPETGVYIVDGDTPLETREQLRAFYEQYIQNGALIVQTNNGVDDRWSDAQKKDLTYCVSTSFGVRYGAVVRAFRAAASAWEQAANVRFIHRSDQDATCTAGNGNVVFDVNPTSGQPYVARAFFPSTSRVNRNVLIDDQAFGPLGAWTLAGVLKHEMGHSLGFRHEHARPEAGTSPNCVAEPANWRALTAYDASSVMHYPQCNGTNTGDLEIRPSDRSGAAALYGAPSGFQCQAVSLQSTNYPDRFVRDLGRYGELTTIATDVDKNESSFFMVTGLAGPGSVSFESSNLPGYFLRRQSDILVLSQFDGTSTFRSEASFVKKDGLDGGATSSFESIAVPGSYIRHAGFHMWVQPDNGTSLFHSDASFRLPVANAPVTCQAVSLQSYNYPDRVIRHLNSVGELMSVAHQSDALDSTFLMITGLAGSGSVSLEAVSQPGKFMKRQSDQLVLQTFSDTSAYRNDASFTLKQGLADAADVSLALFGTAATYVRHAGFHMWTHDNDGSGLFQADASFDLIAPVEFVPTSYTCTCNGWCGNCGIGGDPGTVHVVSPAEANDTCLYKDGVCDSCGGGYYAHGWSCVPNL